MEQNITSKKEPLGKGFYINVSKNHTFGTDAVLLSNFASSKRVAKHCDLGAGCGIISMLLLRDDTVKFSDGVEISDEAVALARRTAAEYAEDRFSVVHSDLKELKGVLPFSEYDLVTCNPPYKADGAGIISESKTDKVARHETACSLEDVIKVASRLLKSSGRLCICQRPERLADIICLMRNYRVEPKTLRFVSKKVGDEPWLVLVEGRRDGKSGMRVLPPLCVYNENGEYSEEMLKIYGPYKEGHI
ncbi:MAG: tRNA1(Val) (adenine(37)-N6)-methyltransferase [Clostridia bacterium]|nr:tRNA1(Val) (adenine(37)-N6)-methyltransferase [Clostridia bacterium]